MRFSFPAAVLSVCAVALLAIAGWSLWPKSKGSLSVLVILDTVRAQNTSVCGYARPTTPNLERLVNEGAHINCDAWVPGSWTLPTHASFFTGLEVPEHHAHLVDRAAEKETEGVRNLGPARGLSTDAVTLADQRPALLVSGNPVLGEASGLNQGFQYSHTGLKFGDTYDDDFVVALTEALATASDGDLLVLNIADAHQPWTDIPDGVEWVPPTKSIKYRYRQKKGLWRRWHMGDRDEKQRQRIVDLYDYAIFCADRTLGKALNAIEQQAFSIGDLTITSDHGEHVGEHNLLGHGHYLTEENQRVPLISTEPLPDGPISATVVYDLALGNEPVARPVRAVSYPHRTRSGWFTEQGLFGQTRARSWSPEQEWTSPQAVPDGDFGQFIERAKKSGIATSDESDLEERLEALGYL